MCPKMKNPKIICTAQGQKRPKKPAYLSVDLFAGAGGLAFGMSDAGFSPTALCEIDPTCCTTLRNNYKKLLPAPIIIQDDVRDIDFGQFCEKIDLLSGGPPCQPFSLAGSHLGYEDHRNMFPTAINVVRIIRPRVFVFENVVGLARPKFRKYFEYLRLQLTHPDIEKRLSETWDSHLGRLERHHSSGSTCGLNYRVLVHQVNVADYGVPQNRSRIFFVGFREDTGANWSFPVETHSVAALIKSMQSGSYWEINRVPKKHRIIPERLRPLQEHVYMDGRKPWRTLREAISDLPHPKLLKQSTAKAELFTQHNLRAGAKQYPGHTGSRLDEPAKTIKAGVHGSPGGENMFVDDKGAVRYLSIRECARVQTFPDSFMFAGAWSSVLRQIGNAVPYDFAHALGREIARIL
jgi:DNA (cytosine-5)-methyltransferase 1